MPVMDEFYQAYVNPFFRSRGFKRKGRAYRRIEANGDTAIFNFQTSSGSMPGRYVFFINVGISHAPWFDYANEVRIQQGGARLREPQVMDSPYEYRLNPPEGYEWIVTEDSAAAVWQSLELILEDAVSQTLRLLDRSEFLNYVNRGGRNVSSTPAILNALLRADSANDEEMEQLVASARDAAPHDVDFAAWMSRYRAKDQTQ